MPYITRCQTGRTSVKIRATKSRRTFSQRTHPIHPIGTQTDILVLFVLFACIWYRLVAFTNSGAKRAELVQNFVARSRVGLFRNERTRSTPLNPKLMFWYVLYHWVHSGPFGCLTKLAAKRAELVPKFVPGCSVGIFRSEHTRSTPLNPKLTFWCVSNYLGASGTVWTLNRCFDAFRTIWVHSGPFACL